MNEIDSTIQLSAYDIMFAIDDGDDDNAYDYDENSYELDTDGLIDGMIWKINKVWLS